jgi:hypothetical protein
MAKRETRYKIAADNNIGTGTVTSIVDNYKIGLDNLDFGSFRELMIQAKKRGMTPSDLASLTRLYNYFKSSEVSENEIESFTASVSAADIPTESIIQCDNQLYEITRGQSIHLHELPGYIEKKLVEKQKIDEEIQQADTILQSKNVTLEAIDEHIKLNEELNKHDLSIRDIGKLLNLLSNAKKYGFDGKEIASKLYNILDLEWKELR